MIENVITDVLRSHLGSMKRAPNGWEHRNCPMCAIRGHRADRKKRFGIDFKPNGAIRSHCFNCGFSGHWQNGWEFPKALGELMEVIGVPTQEIQKIKFEVYRQNNNITSTTTPQDFKPPLTSKWIPQSLPDGTKSFTRWIKEGCEDPNFLKCVEYIYNRGVTDFNNLYWNPSKVRQYNRRILFPFRYQGKIVGWSGRYYGTPASKSIPKYLNMMPTGFIYNVDNQSDYRREYVLVFEGMLDAYFFDGIGALHDNLNQEQIDIINRLGKKVILVPDRDYDGDNLIEIAKKNKWSVSFPNWDGSLKDASDASVKYGKILTLQSILESTTDYKLDIDIKRKFDKTKWRSDGKGKERKD